MTTLKDPEHVPVIIAAGQINDRPEDPDQGLDSLGLMAAALRAAEADLGSPILPQLESLAIVDQISFRELGNLCEPLASAIGANPKLNYQSEAPHGDTPIRLLNEAANRIGAGEVKLAAIVGGEALRTAAARKAKHAGDKKHNSARAASNRREPTYMQRHGLSAPVDVYPLYENAARASYGQTLSEGQAESAMIWSQFSQVAASNDGAWIRKKYRPDEILNVSPTNRPLAFPYTKLTVANSSVNQGAAFIVASLAEARRIGVGEDRMIYVGMGAAAKESGHILKRDRYDRSVSMDVSIRKTLELNQLSGADFDFAELYSCFPCVTKMARRTLDWPLVEPATVFGGLTFGGGPIANYMSHAVVSMVQKLRSEGTNGFLFANGGFATDNHCIVLSNKPVAAAIFPQDYNYQKEADAARGTLPDIDENYTGEAKVESYTIFHDRDGIPDSGVVVAITRTGKRTLAHIDTTDDAELSLFSSGKHEPVGKYGEINNKDGARRFWASASSIADKG